MSGAVACVLADSTAFRQTNYMTNFQDRPRLITVSIFATDCEGTGLPTYRSLVCVRVAMLGRDGFFIPAPR
jgi:hypothetical protein